MRVWKETVTVLAISRMDKDKVGVAGINQHGQWIRPLNLYLKDLEVKGEKVFKVFGRTSFCVFSNSLGEETGRVEDRDIFWHEDNQPVLIEELSGSHKKSFLDRNVDPGVRAVFQRGRTLGMVKPIIDAVEFKINPYLGDYEASFTFRDNTGESFTISCTEINWRSYWLHWVNTGGQMAGELLKMQWTLNEQETYFVIGLSRPVEEWPGPIGGCWPLVLGVVSLSVPGYIRDYNT